MKKSILLMIAISMLFTACSSIPGNIKPFVKKLVNNPISVKDMKTNYPELYNDSLIFKELKDTNVINKIYDFIIDSDLKDYDRLKWYQADSSLLSFCKYQEIEKVGKINDFYILECEKRSRTLMLIFFKNVNYYFLYKIYCLVDPYSI